MNRLTQTLFGICGCSASANECEEIAPKGKSCDTCRRRFKMDEKLSAYEDTGLEPEQIPEMSQIFQAKCEELNHLKEMSEKLQSAYDNLKLMIDDCKKPTCEGCKREKSGRFDYKSLGYCRSCSRAYKDEYEANEQDMKQE